MSVEGTGHRTQQPHIRLLGGFEIRLGGRVLLDSSWPRKKTRSLVKLLALQPGRALHREQVYDILWPGASPGDAGNSLRQALYHLRKATSDLTDPLVETRDTVAALSPGATIDVEEFLTAAKRAVSARGDEACLQALALHSGDLLPADLYEEWTERARAEIRSMRVRLLSRAAKTTAADGHPEMAIRLCEEALQVEPLSEDIVQKLMLLYAAAGKTDQALVQYHRYRRRLTEELAVEPAAEVERVRARILRARNRPRDHNLRNA